MSEPSVWSIIRDAHWHELPGLLVALALGALCGLVMRGVDRCRSK